MPSPNTWDVTKPAGTDPIAQGDDQIRADKTTLRDLLRSLVPFGTTNSTWRQVQINNESWLTFNAKYDGTSWTRDDTTIGSVAIRQAGQAVTIYQTAAGAGAITWSQVANFDNTAAAFNVPVTLPGDPTAALQAATKQYVDNKPSGAGDIRFLVQGDAMVANKVVQALCGTALTYTKLLAYADTAPAGAGLSIRINKNGTQAATLSIPAGSNSASATVSIAVAQGDRISLDITAVGSTTPGGNDLMVTLAP